VLNSASDVTLGPTWHIGGHTVKLQSGLFFFIFAVSATTPCFSALIHYHYVPVTSAKQRVLTHHGSIGTIEYHTVELNFMFSYMNLTCVHIKLPNNQRNGGYEERICTK